MTIDPKGIKRGGVVKGFPLKLIPQPPHADIKRTADIPKGKFRRVSMSGTTARDAKKVLEFYAAPLKKAGFDQLKTKKADKSKSTIFSRSKGKELITVTVTRNNDDTNSFTVGGQIKK